MLGHKAKGRRLLAGNTQKGHSRHLAAGVAMISFFRNFPSPMEAVAP